MMGSIKFIQVVDLQVKVRSTGKKGTHSVVGGCFAFCVTTFVFQDLLRDDTLLLSGIIQALPCVES
jgi:hypothetical protein